MLSTLEQMSIVRILYILTYLVRNVSIRSQSIPCDTMNRFTLIIITLIGLSIKNHVSAIVNGSNADLTPYQVSIQINQTHHCGGVVIDRNFVSSTSVI